jgi:predicted ATPase
MKNQLRISGFKCFYDEEFEINNITLLTGSNGSGKSSLIQALLLYRTCIEKIHNKLSYTQIEKPTIINEVIPLNSNYALNLGTYFDIFREDSNKDSINISIDSYNLTLRIPKEENDFTLVNAEIIIDNNFTKSTFWNNENFYYLNAERIGPRHHLEHKFYEIISCGYSGENTAFILEKYGRDPKFESAMLADKNELLLNLTNNWLDIICPGTSIRTNQLGPLSATIKISTNNFKTEISATNIGFGISYSLPVIVSGLIAKKDTILIVENPEAHLHPKGQSEIGYFLAKVAESGVKVLIETHSEHVTNGVRRGVLESQVLKNEDATIYFFNGINNKKLDKIKIEVDSSGDLTHFPSDFFDQLNQDLSKIFQLKNLKN